MGGYCEMGRLYMARAPAIMMMMAMTQAKTGRSKKNLDNIGLLRSLRRRRRLARVRRLRASLEPFERDDLHCSPRPDFLQAFDDQAITR